MVARIIELAGATLCANVFLSSSVVYRAASVMTGFFELASLR